jgi:hypothetical protein
MRSNAAVDPLAQEVETSVSSFEFRVRVSSFGVEFRVSSFESRVSAPGRRAKLGRIETGARGIQRRARQTPGAAIDNSRRGRRLAGSRALSSRES